MPKNYKGMSMQERQARDFKILDAVIGGKLYKDIGEEHGLSTTMIYIIASHTGYEAHVKMREDYCKARGMTLEDYDRKRLSARKNRGRPMRFKPVSDIDVDSVPAAEVDVDNVKAASGPFNTTPTGRVSLTEAQCREMIAAFYNEGMPYNRAAYNALAKIFGEVSYTQVSYTVRGAKDNSYRLLHEFYHNHKQLPDGGWCLKGKTHFSLETYEKARQLYLDDNGNRTGMSQASIAREMGLPAWSLGRLFDDNVANPHGIPLADMVAHNEQSGIVEHFAAMKPGKSKPRNRSGNIPATDVSQWAKVPDPVPPPQARQEEEPPRGQVVNGRFSKSKATVHDLKQAFKGVLSRAWDMLRIWDLTRSRRYQAGYLAGGEDMLLRLAHAFADSDGGDVSERLAELRSMRRRQLIDQIGEAAKTG